MMRYLTPSLPSPMGQHAGPGDRAGARLGRWLTAGTPYLAGLIAVGGLLVLLAYAVGGWEITQSTVNALGSGFSWTQADSWAAALLRGGNLALDLVPLVVGLYTAYGLAGQSALLPAFAGSAVAVTLNTGVLGGLVTGLVAGGVTRLLRRVEVPTRFRPLAAKAGVPLVATLITMVVFVSALGEPELDHLNEWLYNKQVSLELTGHVLELGLLLGLMASCDFGGILYTSAFGYTVAGIDTSLPTPAHMTFMAVVVASGMVPPLGLALATAVRRKLFTQAERDHGKVAWLLGLGFVPESAAPFALADPLRVFPAIIAGGTLTGALTMTFGPAMAVPHGGVFAVGQIGQPLLFAAAIAAGVVVTAGTVIGLKSLQRTAPVEVRKRPAAARSRKKAPVAG